MSTNPKCHADDRQLQIGDHGIIGNCLSCALVGIDGTIDHYCYPRFDSPTIFARLLDLEKGGYFSLKPKKNGQQDFNTKQFYLPDTNVLETRFFCSHGMGQIVDYMPITKNWKEEQIRTTHHAIVRKIRCVRSKFEYEMKCQPAFNYCRDKHTVEIIDGGRKAIFKSESLTMLLVSSHGGLELLKGHPMGDGVRLSECLVENEEVVFVFREIGKSKHPFCSVTDLLEVERRMMKATLDYWRDWTSNCSYNGRWREVVVRSALVMKLLTYAPTGAIVAAATTSLPEYIGGTRNWDYRFTWIRDAAFVIYGFLRIGFTEEAMDFMDFLEARCKELGDDNSLQLIYRIDGSHDLIEEELDHLSGYCNSKPVRIGNLASKQLQLDIYGELMDSIYLSNKYAKPVSYDLWVHVRRLVEYVCEHWREPDHGIWEIRDDKRHYVYSKVMCWVAVDRGMRLADKRSLPVDINKWRKVRDEIYEDIMANGWNEQLQSFVQYYGSDDLDSSVLIMPMVFFMAPSDPRMLSTIEAIKKGLSSSSCVYRYKTYKEFEDVKTGEKKRVSLDNIEGEEGFFSMCSFWLIEGMTRCGQVEEARLRFEEMLSFANHLGIYAEQTAFDGESTGNFAQAFTHLSLISAAFNLDRKLTHRAPRVLNSLDS